MQEADVDVDVLIVGGGPTGLMLALELAIQKVSFRIIDKLPARSPTSRALVVHPRTLELLHRHGIAEEFIAHGRLNMGMQIYVSEKLAVSFDLQDLGIVDTEFPSSLFISQAETERLLDEAMQRHGHTVQRGVAAERLEQDAAGVTTWLRSEDGKEEHIRCKYIVGCDGAHSVVRHATNLTFEGGAYLQDFVLGDVNLKWDHAADRLTIFMGQGILLAFPLDEKGLTRLIGSRPPTALEPNTTNDDEPTLSEFQELFSQMAPGHAELSDPVWLSRFRLHHRSANCYRDGRMILAGDAAHIHSPAGGQGMNTGMQDAVNLGWKLGRVTRGETDDSLLDSYDVERRRVGENLLRGTDRMFQFGISRNPFFLFWRNLLVPWILPWAIRDRSRRAKPFRFISQLGIRYRHSPVVKTASTYQGPLRGGDRAPDSKLLSNEGSTTLLSLCVGPTHHLLLFSGTSQTTTDSKALQSATANFLEAHSSWVKQSTIVAGNASQDRSGPEIFVDEKGILHARYGFSEPGLVLVRPDGYVAFIGPLDRVDELERWVEGCRGYQKEKIVGGSTLVDWKSLIE